MVMILKIVPNLVETKGESEFICLQTLKASLRDSCQVLLLILSQFKGINFYSL